MDILNHIAPELYAHELRIENMIHIGTQMQFASLPAVVELAFGVDLEQIAEAIGVKYQTLFSMSDEELVYALKHTYKKQGFLVEFATPDSSAMDPHEPGAQKSWMIFRSKWFYGESMEACCAEAIAWKNSRDEGVL